MEDSTFFVTPFPEVWSFTKDLPDFLGHLWFSSSLLTKLQRHAVLVDRKPGKDLARLSDSLDGVLQESTSSWATMSRKDWAKKFVELHWYYLKPHKEVLGQDWKPAESIFSAIETEEINPRYLEVTKELSRVAQMSHQEG